MAEQETSHVKDIAIVNGKKAEVVGTIVGDQRKPGAEFSKRRGETPPKTTQRLMQHADRHAIGVLTQTDVQGQGGTNDSQADEELHDDVNASDPGATVGAGGAEGPPEVPGRGESEAEEPDDIELARSTVVDDIFEKFQDVDPSWEQLDEEAYDALVERPFMNAHLLQGIVAENDAFYRLSQIAHGTPGLIELNPITQADAQTEHFNFLVQGNHLIVRDNESGKDVTDYDSHAIIVDPVEGRIPLIVEVKTGIPNSQGRRGDELRKIIGKKDRNIRLRPIHEYYKERENIDKVAAVVVINESAINDESSIRTEFRDSGGKMEKLPFSVDELREHVAAVFARFERIDTSAETEPPVPEDAPSVEEVVQRYSQTIGDQGIQALPSLNEFARNEGISRSAARQAYEMLKQQGIIHLESGSHPEVDRRWLRAEDAVVVPRERIEARIAAFLDSNLQEGELLVPRPWSMRLQISTDAVNRIFRQLAEEGYLTETSSGAMYLGRDRDTFHRRYHTDPKAQVREYLNGLGRSSPRAKTAYIAQRFGINPDIIVQVKEERGREKVEAKEKAKEIAREKARAKRREQRRRRRSKNNDS
jgi:DNA-binding transcriptional regulator YhcF (GntR family)